MRTKPIRLLRIAVAICVFVALTAFFLDFDNFVPFWTSFIAKIQFVPSIFAGSCIVFAALVVATILFGRIYCSIVCPLGMLQDLIAWIARRCSSVAAFVRRFCPQKSAEQALQTAQSAQTDGQSAAKPVVKAKPRAKKAGVRNYRYTPNRLKTRIGFLALALASFPVGGCVFALLEPYGIFGRIATNVFLPIRVWINNLLYAHYVKQENFSFYYVDLRPESWGALVVGVLSFLILIAFAARFGRTYCNAVCPVGTILGFLSKFSFFKIRLNAEKCVRCGLCAKACKSGCIDVATGKIDNSRCVVCFDCLGTCRKKAISYSQGRNALTLAPNEVEKTEKTAKSAQTAVVTPREAERAAEAVRKFDRGKREFLTLATLATTAVAARAVFGRDETAVQTSDASSSTAPSSVPSSTPVAASETAVPNDASPDEIPADYGLTPFKRQFPISPAGSRSHREFNVNCVGCHLCVAKCPSNVLKPAGLEYGLRGFMQPRVEFSHGFCNFDCTVCGDVCPAGAILPLTQDEKHVAQPGRVVFIKENCIVYAKNTSCGACSEHCPTQAVKMVPYGENGLTIPETNDEICVGCGACEYICPARPYRAIYIEGNPVHQQAKPIEKEEQQDVGDLDFGF